MYRFLQPIAAGAPRLVGPAAGNYIGPPGPSFTVQQWMIPWTGLPLDKDPKYNKKIASAVRSINFPKIKARNARPRSPRGGFAMKKPLRIAVRVGQHENNGALERTSPFDALGYSPRYLLRNGSGKAPKRLAATQTRPLRPTAGNEAVAGLEPALMAESEQLA